MLLLVFLISFACLPSFRSDDSKILIVTSNSKNDDAVEIEDERNFNALLESPNFYSDVDLPTPDMIRREGYYAESHVVETEDGYLLTLHRIPGAVGSSQSDAGNKKNDKKPSVILQHGLLSSSADWVITGKGKALAYELVDRGYDVWLGNARGNTYSRAHVSLSVSDSKFWDFTWHEMGVYDLPAVIDYITSYKNEETLIYVGHSMGTTMFYVMASERPDIARKIRAMFSLAPVAFLDHVKSPIRILAPFVRDIEFIARLLGANEFLPQGIILRFLARFGCDINVSEEKICANSLFVLVGFDKDQFNDTLLPTILGHSPAGASTKTLLHYAQGIKSGKFREYDYGAVKNLEIYHNVSPPDYNLSKIDVPVSLHYADNDWLASVTDVDRLYQALPKKLGKYRVNFPKFNHVDFLWGIDAPKLVYDNVLSIMEKYRRKFEKKLYLIGDYRMDRLTPRNDFTSTKPRRGDNQI